MFTQVPEKRKSGIWQLEQTVVLEKQLAQLELHGRHTPPTEVVDDGHWGTHVFESRLPVFGRQLVQLVGLPMQVAQGLRHNGHVIEVELVNVPVGQNGTQRPV